MSALDSPSKSLVFAIPLVAVVALLGWETDWGHALKREPALDANVPAQPVTVRLLPEYTIDGGVESRWETAERTLFNPTRRPAPSQQAATAESALPRGQFVLIGTMVVDQKVMAFLREVKGGRSRRVTQGETIDGLMVAEVGPDRVKLLRGGEFEELTLKVAPGPKTTIQPQASAAPPAAQSGAPPAPQPAQQNVATSQQPGQPQDTAEAPATRRRDGRPAAAVEQSAQHPEQANAFPEAPVYQRFLQRRR